MTEPVKAKKITKTVGLKVGYAKVADMKCVSCGAKVSPVGATSGKGRMIYASEPDIFEPYL
jgi:hypothetical protein